MPRRRDPYKRDQNPYLTHSLNDLAAFVDPLNKDVFWARISEKEYRRGDYRPMKKEFRRLVSLWKESGPNLSKLFKEHPEIEDACRKMRAFLLPTDSGTGRIVLVPGIEGMEPSNPETIALDLFRGLLMNPYSEYLGGPCVRCDRYYVKKTKAQTHYCSQACGHKDSSAGTNRRDRQKTNSHKLVEATKYVDAWKTARTKDAWKSWVSKRSNISKNWLTRAVNRGDLQEPEKTDTDTYVVGSLKKPTETS